MLTAHMAMHRPIVRIVMGNAFKQHGCWTRTPTMFTNVHALDGIGGVVSEATVSGLDKGRHGKTTAICEVESYSSDMELRKGDPSGHIVFCLDGNSRGVAIMTAQLWRNIQKQAQSNAAK